MLSAMLIQESSSVEEISASFGQLSDIVMLSLGLGLVSMF